ncbi:reverse transcriptase [Tanacetum coccineum]
MVQIYSDEAVRLFHVVWKEKVPNKVKIFVRRAWHNFVPSINNLQARGLNITASSCTHCGDPEEDVVHVLFKCLKAKGVWDRCSFKKLYDTPGATTIGDFCRVVLDTFPTCWDIFYDNSLLLDYSDANKKDGSRGVDSIQTTFVGVWKKPQAGKFKFNCDAAWQKESGKVGLGFVARNCNGEELISGAKSECYANSPLEAESKAIWWANIHARSRGYSNVVFETDSLSLVNALRNQCIPLQIATLFSDILSNLRSFNICEWSFTRKDGNKVAHSMASWALRCTNTVIIEGKVPNCASVLAVKDVISSDC